MLTLTAMQMKNAERLADERGVSYRQMMENAGSVAFQYMKLRYDAPRRSCVILVGKGNNGGDGFVLARRLAEAGSEVTVLLCCGEPGTSLAGEAYGQCLECGCRVADPRENPEAAGLLASAQLIVDGVFGTGFHGKLDDETAVLFKSANEAGGVRLALDVPSGLEADTGMADENCFRADVTLSFAAAKPAHNLPETREWCGRVEVLDIGIPADVIFAAANNAQRIEGGLIRSLLPSRNPDSHKGSYGSLLVVAGSRGMAGAAMMATFAAMRIGAGKTVLASEREVVTTAAPYLMEAVTLALPDQNGVVCIPEDGALDRAVERSSALLAGCGLGTVPSVRELIRHLMETAGCPMLLDADALNCLQGEADRLNRCRRMPVITPHPGEMARLCGMTVEQVVDNAMSVARLFAREKNAVVVLKGHRTVVATPAGEVFSNTTGNAGLAKGGSGDVLSGMIAGLMAQGLPQREAALCGVWLHGRCADSLAERMSQYSMLARDLLSELPRVMKALGL